MTDTSSLTPSPWTPERVAELKALRWQGKSAGVIADELGNGISRNAVIGKLSRLGDTKKGKPSIRQAPRRSVQRQKPSLATILAPDTPFVDAEPPVAFVEHLEPAKLPIVRRLTVEMLTAHTCRWPIGDPRDDDFGFCGAEPEPGKPYCPYHCIIAYERRTRSAA